MPTGSEKTAVWHAAQERNALSAENESGDDLATVVSFAATQVAPRHGVEVTRQFVEEAEVAVRERLAEREDTEVFEKVPSTGPGEPRIAEEARGLITETVNQLISELVHVVDGYDFRKDTDRQAFILDATAEVTAELASWRRNYQEFFDGIMHEPGNETSEFQGS